MVEVRWPSPRVVESYVLTPERLQASCLLWRDEPDVSEDVLPQMAPIFISMVEAHVSSDLKAAFVGEGAVSSASPARTAPLTVCAIMELRHDRSGAMISRS